MRNFKKYFWIILISVYSIFLINCSEPTSSLTDIPINELLSAPEIIETDNKNIKLKTIIYLDLQPVVSPNPMIAIVFIETIDSSDIPSIIDPKSIYIIKDSEVWKSFFSSEEPPASDIKPFRIIKVARNGPYWGPDIYVDVIVNLKIRGKSYLLRASNQHIGSAI